MSHLFTSICFKNHFHIRITFAKTDDIMKITNTETNMDVVNYRTSNKNKIVAEKQKLSKAFN